MRLDALGRIDDEDGAFAGLQASRHLVIEVDVSRRIDQVYLIFDPVLHVRKANGLSLDRDPAFALDIQIIEELGTLLTLAQRAGDLKDTIGERAFAVIDVRNDRKISDELGVVRHRSWRLFLSEGGIVRSERGRYASSSSVHNAPRDEPSAAGS